MKMEVVLSAPGCFGNDGTPFKSEEIREWSRIDRLTGMLERARIETDRWQTANDASMHSYGKASDLRERNSADGCIRQKAKRQVEIFQSQEPGRSVQVFRTSQWSSSRITDGTAKSIMPTTQLKDSMLDGIDEVLKADGWEFPTLKLSSLNSISIDSNDDDNKTSQSIKDLSLKDLNGFKKYLLPKRSNSNEDLSNHIGTDESSRTSSLSFTRDCKNRRSLQIPTSVSILIPNYNELKTDIENKKGHSSKSSATSEIYAPFVRNENERKSSDYGSLRVKNSIATSMPRHSHSSSTTRPNAITVINLMNPESFQDNLRNKKSSIVTLRPSSMHSEDMSKSCKSLVTKGNSSGDESGINLPGRAIKKVGFCKTEVHFAADSGKVNIVETDGKPPPTNKFRRRRKNHNHVGQSGNLYGRSMECNTTNSNNGNVKLMPRRMIIKSDIPDDELIVTEMDNDNSGAYCIVDLESKKFWTHPDFNPRMHTTTVNFGKSDKRTRDVEELKKSDDLTSPKVIGEILTRKSKGPNYNIITTDSENNSVLSTVVTTHESTVARVEDNHINGKKLTEKYHSKSSPLLKKKNVRKVMSNVDITDKPSKILKNGSSYNLKESPIYVNVFKTIDDRYPIYENYRADDMNEKMTNNKSTNMESSIMKKLTLEKKRNKSKSPNKFGKRSPISLSRLSSLSRSSDKSQNDSMRIKALKKSTINEETIKSIEKSSTINAESKTVKPDYETGSTRSKRVPMQVVYRTAVFNMKNEKLSKPVKGKDTKVTPRSINDLICGKKTNRINSSKHKSSTSSQLSTKGAPQTKHWK